MSNQIIDPSCPFCLDVSNMLGGNIKIHEIGDNTIFADIAPIKSGHVLVCPNNHYTSLANTSPLEVSLILSFVAELRRKWEACGFHTIISEHGTGVRGGPSNACCEHAHLHVLPFQKEGDVRAIIDIYHDVGGVPNILKVKEDLQKYCGRSYNLLSSDGEQFMIWDNISDFYPQFFRAAACRVLGYSQGDRRYFWQSCVDKRSAIDTAQSVGLNLGLDNVNTIRSFRSINKLVRKNVVDLITASGERPVGRRIGEKAVRDTALSKVHEELEEFLDTPTSEEAADLIEAIKLLLKAYGLRYVDVQKVAQQKAERLGDFDDGIFLEFVLSPKKKSDSQ